MSAIKYSKDQDNIVTLTLDSTGQSVNTMNAEFHVSLHEVTAKIKAETNLAGVIFTSAKKTFFAGGDLTDLIKIQPSDVGVFFASLEALKADMRSLETLGVPVVAALNGAAMGGGWEIALATHRRIALADPTIKFALPEVTLGLLPGGGGVARMVRLLGLQAALPFLMEGKQFDVKKAVSLGLVHDTGATMDEVLQKSRDWIKANPPSVKPTQQPFDVKGYKIPGGDPRTPAIGQMLAIAPAMLRDKTKGCYPAPEAIMSAAVEGALVDIDTALRIESRYFMRVGSSQVAKNMIGTFFFQLNSLKAGHSRPAGIAPWKATKVGVLGAGMMGSGIAYATAIKGVEVVLKDVTAEAAAKGKNYSEKLLDKRVSRGSLTTEKKDAILSKITATANAADLAGCDLIIEAVFENRDLKAKVTQEAEGQLVAGGIMASNTSTLPITGLSKASKDSSRFIGLHFFSPVDKMQLVEIIKGKDTSPETLARAFDYVLQIGKTPIVVNDSRGFFTSRVFGTFVNEGLRLVAEGVHPARIEMAALKAGMPVGPLAIQDEVSLSLTDSIADQTRKDLLAEGKDMPIQPSEALVKSMLQQHNRKGKAAGAGFYEYPEGGKKHLWSGLKQWLKPEVQIDEQEMIERILFVQALDTLRCLEEGVLESVQDANIGSIFGIGFAAWTGGAVQYINQYGVAKALKRAEELTAKYGERFTPPQSLKDKAAKGELFV